MIPGIYHRGDKQLTLDKRESSLTIIVFPSSVAIAVFLFPVHQVATDMVLEHGVPACKLWCCDKILIYTWCQAPPPPTPHTP